VTAVKSASVKPRKRSELAAQAAQPLPAAAAKPTGSAWDKARKPAEVTSLKTLLFGPPGTGKTIDSLRGEGRKLLVLSDPEGDLSLNKHPDVAKGVTVIEATSWKDHNDIVQGLFGPEKNNWDRVVIDSATSMFERIGGKNIAEVARENKDVRRPFLAAGSSMNQLIFDLVALPMDVVFTAQMVSENHTDEDGNTVVNPEEGKYPLTVALSPMVYKVLVPSLSLIGRTYKQQGYAPASGNKPAQKVVEYWVSFEDFGRSPARSRITVPSQVRDLDLTALRATIGRDN
jgi:hypothetical protein